jgi:hypothetical protein
VGKELNKASELYDKICKRYMARFIVGGWYRLLFGDGVGGIVGANIL